MTINVGVGGAHKNVIGMWVGVGGAWKYVTRVDAGVSGAWKLAFAPLELTCNDISGENLGTAFSGSVRATANATVQYGSGNYTYSWVHNSTSSGNTPSISSATALNPTFTAAVTAPTNSVSSWTLTVTDSTYGISDSVTVTVTLDWIQETDPEPPPP